MGKTARLILRIPRLPTEGGAVAKTTLDYKSMYARSLEDPESFWSEAAREIVWSAPFQRVFDDSRPPFYRCRGRPRR